jgi:predicted anti-sigma-YlaC factor YlaD
MNCKSVQNQLSAYLDREIAGDEMLAIRAHLHDCAECREEAEALKTLKRMLTASPVPEPPADLADRLCATVFATRPADVERRERRVTLRVSLLTFGSVAALSMALTFGALTNARPGSSPATSAVAKDATPHDLAFEVQRDQMYAVGFDTTSSVPVISSSTHVRR